jgi:hypothetical protein
MNDIKDFLKWLGHRFLEAINPFHPEFVRPTWEEGKNLDVYDPRDVPYTPLSFPDKPVVPTTDAVFTRPPMSTSRYDAVDEYGYGDEVLADYQRVVALRLAYRDIPGPPR